MNIGFSAIPFHSLPFCEQWLILGSREWVEVLEAVFDCSEK